MKKNLWIGLSAAMAGGLFAIILGTSGCAVDANGHAYIQMPTLVVAAPVMAQPVIYAPAPAVVVEEPTVLVPESYVIVDGEYVGLVGDQYYYLGANSCWFVCDSVRIGRFHEWERGHPDWRGHAVMNDRFRNDARGHFQPQHRSGPGSGPSNKKPTPSKKEKH